MFNCIITNCHCLILLVKLSHHLLQVQLLILLLIVWSILKIIILLPIPHLKTFGLSFINLIKYQLLHWPINLLSVQVLVFIRLLIGVPILGILLIMLLSIVKPAPLLLQFHLRSTLPMEFTQDLLLDMPECLALHMWPSWSNPLLLLTLLIQ